MRLPSTTLPLLVLGGFLASGCSDDPVTPPARSCVSELVYTPEDASFSGPVAISGEWDAFPAKGKELKRREDGSYALKLELDARDWAYAFIVNGQTTLDPKNPFTRWVANTEYSRLRVPDCQAPLLELRTFETSPEGTLKLEVAYFTGRGGTGTTRDLVELVLDGERREIELSDDGRISFSASGLAPGKHTVKLQARDTFQREAEPLYLPFWIESEPFSWEGATMYFALIDRFRNGDPRNDEPVLGVDPMANFRGGDFAGIRKALEEGYFDALGVNVLWLSPVDENPDGAFPGKFDKRYSAYHGYWPSQPVSTQRRFGSFEELRQLTAAAHARGIRVIVDVVFNHVHETHPYYLRERTSGWFNVSGACTCGEPGCDWQERRLDCWFTPYLPDLNWRNSEAASRFEEDALKLIETADLDGFRVDAVKHMDHVATRSLRGRLAEITQRTGTRYYLVGETLVGTDGRPLLAEYISPNELDGQFDFPLYWMVIDSFARKKSLELLDDAVAQNEAFYAPGTINAPFLGNHDVPRFLSMAAGQVEEENPLQAWGPTRPPERIEDEAPFAAAKLAFTFVLTQPGLPMIYYGDEVGLAGANDPDNRRMMRFGEELLPREQDLLTFVQKVGKARREFPALRSNQRTTLSVSPDLYIYRRDSAQGSALVALYRGATPRTVTLPLRGSTQGLGEGALRNLLEGSATASVVGEQVTITFAGGSEPAIFVSAGR